jgi:hypothetical protein
LWDFPASRIAFCYGRPHAPDVYWRDAVEMSEKFDAEGLLEKYANVETTVVYFDRTDEILSSLRCAAKYLKEHPTAGRVGLHVHVSPIRIIVDDELRAIVDAV